MGCVRFGTIKRQIKSDNNGYYGQGWDFLLFVSGKSGKKEVYIMHCWEGHENEPPFQNTPLVPALLTADKRLIRQFARRKWAKFLACLRKSQEGFL